MSRLWLPLAGLLALGTAACSNGATLIAADSTVESQVETPVDTPAPTPIPTTTSAPSTIEDDLPPETWPDKDTFVVADPQNWVGYLEGGEVYDPLWYASVTLTCGSTPEARLVKSFEAETNGRAQETRLYSGEESGNMFTLEVGQEFPEHRRLAWQIPGFYLGPWQVDEVIDQCDPS